MPQSHHSHSGQFCQHASGSLEDVVIEAMRQGFDLYGLTEHVPRYRPDDLYPEEAGQSLEAIAQRFDEFIEEAHRLKTVYATQITLLVGLETEYITELDLDCLDGLLQKHGGRVQYVVGSVHHVNGIPIDFDFATFNKCLRSFAMPGPESLDHSQQLLCSYFDAQFAVLRRFHPEIIGHIDLCRLYNPSLRLQDYSEAWSRLERNVRLAVDYGALFEVNAAALRKGWSTSYPGTDVLELIVHCGGRFALSDDSHGPHGVGLNYSRLADYLRRMNVRELWYLKECAVPNAAGRYVTPAVVEGDWWEHAFWKNNRT